jgi:hypothetical protein
VVPTAPSRGFVVTDACTDANSGGVTHLIDDEDADRYGGRLPG